MSANGNSENPPLRDGAISQKSNKSLEKARNKTPTSRGQSALSKTKKSDDSTAENNIDNHQQENQDNDDQEENKLDTPAPDEEEEPVEEELEEPLVGVFTF